MFHRFIRYILPLALAAGTVAPTLASAQDGALTGFSFAPIGTYSTGLGNLSGESVAVQGTRAFVTNSADNSLDIVDASVPGAPRRIQRISLTAFGAGPNSVAVHGDIVAVAVEANPKTEPGSILLFDLDGRFINSVPVGALPDMITFTPDGKHLLVANEGEPNDLYTVDPEGTVSIITVRPFVAVGRGGGRGTPQAVKTVDFRDFNVGGPRHAELDPRIRIFGPNASVAQDLEPEYIAVSPDSRTAYVTLQENNAVAVIDINSGSVRALLPLGLKDHSLAGNGLDASDRDNQINIRRWPVFGMYQSDAIAAFEILGERYLITANEGDARVYPPADIPGGPAEGSVFNEEIRVGNGAYVLDPTAFPNAAILKNNANLGRLNVTRASGDADGDGDFDRIEVFGTRSFSIWTAGGSLVWDSGDQFEQITARLYPGNFNASNSNNTFDDRSDNKGPEPEGVAVGQINGRTYAFVGLERIGGVMIYDVTDPRAPRFVQYVNNRNFAQSPPGPDSGPEVIVFVPAEKSPSGKPRLITANEVSGTVTVYEASPVSEATTLTLLHNADGESSLLPGSAGLLSVGGAAAFKSVMDREIRLARGAGNSLLTVYAGDSFLASSTLACSLPPNPATTPVFDAVAQRQMAYDAHVLGNHEFDFSPDFLERFIRAFAADGRLTQPFLSANLDFGAEPGFADLVDEDGIVLGSSTDGRVVARSAVIADPSTGQRFGIVGATTPELPTISSPRNVTTTPDLASTATVVQAEIDRLLGRGIRKVILVSHLQSVANDRQLIALLRSVDIAVAGGGDDQLNNPFIPDFIEFLPGDTPLDPADPNNRYPAPTPDADGRTVYLVTTGGNYRYLGRIDATFDADGEVVRIARTSYARRVIIGNGSGAGFPDAVTPNPGVVATVNTPVNACLAALGNPIARSEVVLNVARGAFSAGIASPVGVRSAETNSGNLVTDAFVAAYDRYAAGFGLPARGAANLVVAAQNGGGMRQTGTTSAGVLPVGGVSPGPVTRQNTLDLLAFLTNVTTVVNGVSAEQLRLILERSAAQPGGGQFLQVSGFKVTYDLAQPAQVVGAPPPGAQAGTISFPGQRVREVVYTGGNADPSDDVTLVTGSVAVAGAPEVRIVTNSFTAAGGDNYAVFADIPAARKVVLPATYEQALVEYLVSFPAEEGLPSIQSDDPRYAPNVNQRIFGIPR